MIRIDLKLHLNFLEVAQFHFKKLSYRKVLEVQIAPQDHRSDLNVESIRLHREPPMFFLYEFLSVFFEEGRG